MRSAKGLASPWDTENQVSRRVMLCIMDMCQQSPLGNGGYGAWRERTKASGCSRLDFLKLPASSSRSRLSPAPPSPDPPSEPRKDDGQCHRQAQCNEESIHRHPPPPESVVCARALLARGWHTPSRSGYNSRMVSCWSGNPTRFLRSWRAEFFSKGSLSQLRFAAVFHVSTGQWGAAHRSIDTNGTMSDKAADKKVPTWRLCQLGKVRN